MRLELVSTDSMARVYRIAVGQKAGTGFVVEEEGKYYLLTAKHLFEAVEYPNKFNIGIEKNSSWDEFDANIYYHHNTDIDIAVIQTSYFDDMNFAKVRYDSKKLFVSQSVYMLGYPYGIKNRLLSAELDFPYPIVKRGVYSGVIVPNGNIVHVIDWNGNPGFSGGPVIYHSYNDEDDFEEEFIAGIISSGHTHETKVLKPEQQETECYINEESGIGFVYTIENALEIIREYVRLAT